MLSTEGMIYAHNSKRVLGLILDVLVEEYCLRAQVFPKLCNHRTIKKKKKGYSGERGCLLLHYSYNKTFLFNGKNVFIVMFTDMFNKKSLTKQYIKAIHFLVDPPKALYTLGRAQKRLERINGKGSH